MTAPPFRLERTPEFISVLARVKKSDQIKYRKILKTVRLLRDEGPGYPGLESHKYQSLTGPQGEDLWESYVENKTPGAWLLSWCYSKQPDTLILVTVGPHS
jgi:mRNA-degrading endonuclease YafQ of YafQ-DinJ toxin-antitoxin module